MKRKKCNECGRVREVLFFSKEKRALNGYKPRCKDCLNAYYRKRYPVFRDKKLKAAKHYADVNKAVIRERRVFHNVDLSRKALNNKNWRLRNAETLRVKANEYEKGRIKNNPDHRFRRNVRKLLYRLRCDKRGHTADILGYSIADLHNHFTRYPKVDESIDHKIPVSWFNKGTPPWVINHLDNLQLLSRSENSCKNNTFCHPVTIIYYLICIPFIKLKYSNRIIFKHGK